MAVLMVRRWWRQWSDNWLRRRLPRTRATTLNQRRIFILPTRNGVYFLLMTFAIFLGGINYSNSLVLGTAFLLVSLFMISILHTFANLSGLRVSAGRAEGAFVGEEAAFTLRLSAAGGRQHQAVKLSWGRAIPQYVDLVDCDTAAATLLLPVTRRGRYRPRRLMLESNYPLGLQRAWSWIDLDMAVLVYPRPIVCDYSQRLHVDKRPGEQQTEEGSDDFHGLREYQRGDNPRHIAWRSYARTQELHSKTFVTRRSSEWWLEWEAFAGFGVEERLGRLCYWVCKLAEEGHSYGLRLPGVELGPADGALHRRHCLEALALYGEVQP
ncbi:DUF58 domain-containing protein [Motiliproteus sediminis]|uniref:DUF58 domain-containing protein n=1 Tax=Motiliproteus sediminis TaxID=1468178 RepID=UPI001AEFC41C|nr:DUF58 domain-containing protein [Motiliproteus sediminis]